MRFEASDLVSGLDRASVLPASEEERCAASFVPGLQSGGF